MQAPAQRLENTFAQMALALQLHVQIGLNAQKSNSSVLQDSVCLNLTYVQSVRQTVHFTTQSSASIPQSVWRLSQIAQIQKILKLLLQTIARQNIPELAKLLVLSKETARRKLKIVLRFHQLALITCSQIQSKKRPQAWEPLSVMFHHALQSTPINA